MIHESKIERATCAELAEWCAAQGVQVARSWPRAKLLAAALAQRARLQEAYDAEVHAALVWREDVDRDVAIPPAGQIVYGWDYEVFSGCVVEAYVPAPSGRPLYSTRRRALLALRHVVARRCAESLLRLDREIAEEAP